VKPQGSPGNDSYLLIRYEQAPRLTVPKSRVMKGRPI